MRLMQALALLLAGCAAESVGVSSSELASRKDCEYGAALDCCGDLQCRPERGVEPPCPIACIDYAVDCCGNHVPPSEDGSDPPCPIFCPAECAKDEGCN
jgi:hypothetical protein